MKILVAPDSFKGSLEASEICDIAEKVAKEIFTDVEVLKLPMADGGEGTVTAVLSALKGEEVSVTVKSPDFRDITAKYGIFGQNSAIMEMAEASGITKVENRDILKMNTYGTGMMIMDAIDRGVKTIYIGIGGSATNDCGIGFASAIGIKFLDKDGAEVFPIPENFSKIASIDDSSVSPKIKDTDFIVMCDVKNPLLGIDGATNVFSRQKGASDDTMKIMEESMSSLAAVIEKTYGEDIITAEGAGAAGGLGAALLAFTCATMKSGVSAILDILEFDKHLEGSDLVLTGEGRMDYQSAFGKVAFGVGSKCKASSIPCIAIVGGLGERYEEMYDHGITSIMTTVDGIMSIDDAVANAHELCEKAIKRVFKLVNVYKG